MPPPRPRQLPTGIVPGYVWMGLLDTEHNELHVAGYARQRVQIPSGESMLFEATFPAGMTAHIDGVALYLCEQGGELLWRKADINNPMIVRPDVTVHMALTVNDVSGEMGERCGFRKVLRLMGVL